MTRWFDLEIDDADSRLGGIVKKVGDMDSWVSDMV